MENTNYTYDFFISYSFADSERVEDLCSWLENRGYKCFIAHRNMPKGVNFSDVIPWAIENSRLMIAIMTKRFDTSEHTSREVSLASDAGLPVLTVRLEKYQMTGAKKYYLNDVNWVDATVDDTNLYEEIEQAALSLIANSKRAPKSADSTPQPAAKRRRRHSRFAVSNMLVGALLVAAIVAIVVLVTNRASRGGMDINIDSVVSQGIADKMAEERHEKDSMQHRLDSLEQADMLRRAEEQQKAFHKMEVALLNASKKNANIDKELINFLNALEDSTNLTPLQKADRLEKAVISPLGRTSDKIGERGRTHLGYSLKTIHDNTDASNRSTIYYLMGVAYYYGISESGERNLAAKEKAIEFLRKSYREEAKFYLTLIDIRSYLTDAGIDYYLVKFRGIDTGKIEDDQISKDLNYYIGVLCDNASFRSDVEKRYGTKTNELKERIKERNTIKATK